METVIILLIILGIYLMFSYGKKTGKAEEKKLPIFLIAKYKTKDNNLLKENMDYIIEIWFSYPQCVTVRVLNLERVFCSYESVGEFTKNWECVYSNTNKMQLYLGGEFEYDFPKNFAKLPESSNYDNSSHAYLKNLFEEYRKNHKNEKEQLRKMLQEINTEPST